jgi:hypothetical protein
MFEFCNKLESTFQAIFFFVYPSNEFLNFALYELPAMLQIFYYLRFFFLLYYDPDM